MKLYDETKKLTDYDIIKWILLYFKGIKENSFLWKIIIVILSIASSAAAITPFTNGMSASTLIICTGFLSLCTMALFLPFRSPIRSSHWDYRILFILAYAYRMYKTVKSLIFTTPGDSDEFWSCWSMYWIIHLLIFAAVLQLNLLIHKLHAKNNKKVLKLYEIMSKLSVFSKIREKNDLKIKKFVVLNAVIFLLGAGFFATSTFLNINFGNMNIDTIIFTIRFSNGSYSSTVRNTIIITAAAVILATVVYSVLIYKRYKAKALTSTSPDKKQTMSFNLACPPKFMAYIISFGVIIYGAVILCNSIELPSYIKRKFSRTTIYEDYYVAPTQDVVHFPEKKKNLIYIYLESYENTFTSFENGGNQPIDYMPEIYRFEQENINFSNNSGVGGQSVFFPVIQYTMGSTVAQTSGVPLSSVLVTDRNSMALRMSSLLGPLRKLEDILHDEGYNQLFIRGENTNFAGYNRYVGRYDNSKIYDVNNAIADGKLPDPNPHPWGIQDSLLFSLLKEHIEELAEQEAPFCVSTYTVDTHSFEGGFRCELCDPEIKSDYAASIRCSSHQVADLISWLSEKPYWEDTVVILVGDHPAEHNVEGVRFDEDNYLRTTCNCIINSPKSPVKEKNRTFCAVDMFPTTLSAIGCTIDGDRLGLGTDLFSGTPTLCEEMGADAFVDEVQKRSDFYNDNFLSRKKFNDKE